MNMPLKRLKKGEMLFSEGDPSKAMYFVQNGTIRLFKKKGTSSIELGMIHKGEVIGEMGFLDGGARSASAEAMHDTELMEISGQSMVEQMKVLPSWLMVLLKTIVNRLRSANNKIRQLESATTAYTYGSEGVSTTYQFLTVYDVMKICTAILVVGSRNAQAGPNNSLKCAMVRIQKYANLIMGIHVTKITEMIDILERVGLVTVDRTTLDKMEVHVYDLDQIETIINYINEENLKDHTKKTTLSIKAVSLMGYFVKHISAFEPNAEGISTVNIAKIIEDEKAANSGKEPFKIDDSMTELVKNKLATELSLKDSKTILTQIKTKEFVRAHRVQRVIKEIDTLNDQKREHAAKGNSMRR